MISYIPAHDELLAALLDEKDLKPGAVDELKVKEAEIFWHKTLQKWHYRLKVDRS